MKKMCLLLCIILIIQLFAGCGNKKDEIQQPVNFYYVSKSISYNTLDGVITPEVREGSGYYGLESLLHDYLRGPLSTELQSMLPNDVSLLSCAVENDVADITLNAQFAELSGIRLTTVCSAILLTARDYANVKTVIIHAENSKLDDKDVFVLSVDDIVLMDTITNQDLKE